MYLATDTLSAVVTTIVTENIIPLLDLPLDKYCH